MNTAENLMKKKMVFKTELDKLTSNSDVLWRRATDRLAEIMTKASNLHLEPKRLCLLRHRENGPISLILLKFRKGGKPGLIITEQALYDTGGSPTAYYKSIYHLGA